MAKEQSNTPAVKGILETLVLCVLGESDNYGFGIIQSISSQLGDDGAVLREPTLYPLLHRLEERELVDSYWQSGQRGTDRKYYCLTSKGQCYLQQRIDDWRKVAKILKKVVIKE